MRCHEKLSNIIQLNWFSCNARQCENSFIYNFNWFFPWQVILILPLPLRPTNRKSLNLATWFFITAVQLRSSPHQFSSLPAITVTSVPSLTSPKATTLNAPGNVLLLLQWFGNVVHTYNEIAFQWISRNYYWFWI